jgi:integrase
MNAGNPYRLEPITPEGALELYLDEMQQELSQATLYSRKSRIGHFLRWCEEKGIDNLNDLTGRHMHEYRIWRRDEGNLKKVSLKGQMDTMRAFTRWCESIDAVHVDLSTKVISPTLSVDEGTRDVMLTSEQAEGVLDYLAKYEYASLPHVVVSLLWHTMMRRGAARALDLSDYHRDEQYLSVVHRPETGTAIKNGKRGERLVALSDPMCALLDDWIADKRPDVQDEYGREPLLTTEYGRVSAQTIQTYVYAVTRPCVYTGECPHERDTETCEAAQRKQFASRCPSSISPHAIRRGSITHWLNRDVPMQVVSDRANVSQDILDKHYDRRSEHDKMEQRRRYLDNI